MSIEIVAGLVVLALGVFAILQKMVVHYVKKSEHQRIHRWLEAEARKVGEDVVNILGGALPSDDELLADIRPDGMPEPGDSAEASGVSDVDEG
jgi:hypothetical protein